MTTLARLPFDARNVRTFTATSGRTLAYVQLQPLPPGATDEVKRIFAKGDIAFDSYAEWPADAAARDPDLAENDAFFGPGYWNREAPAGGSDVFGGKVANITGSWRNNGCTITTDQPTSQTDTDSTATAPTGTDVTTIRVGNYGPLSDIYQPGAPIGPVIIRRK